MTKASVLIECGKALQRGAPVLDAKGNPVKDKHGKPLYEPYVIKVFNTINFKKSQHYNPFSYIHSEKDILKLVTALIANTKGDGKAGDEFWTIANTKGDGKAGDEFWTSATRSPAVRSWRTRNVCCVDN